MLIKISLCAAVLFGIAAAADHPVSDVIYPLANGCPQGGCPGPFVDKGYLIYLKDHISVPPDGLTVFDPTGRLVYQVDITAPDGSPGHLHPRSSTIGVGTDGTVLLPISYGGYGGNGHVKGGGIVVLDRDGRQIRFVDTARFLPGAACFGPDRSIWVIGTQFTPLRDGDSRDHVESADYNLVRKYSANGKQIGSFLPRSLFLAGLSPGAAGWMRASRDRIGVMTYPGQSANNPEWVELDLDGNLQGRWKLGPQLTPTDPETHASHALEGFAFTEDGHLFAEELSCSNLNQCSDRLVALDRASSTWKPVEDGLVDRFHHLVGEDGNKLVLWDRSQPYAGGVHLLRVQPR